MVGLLPLALGETSKSSSYLVICQAFAFKASSIRIRKLRLFPILSLIHFILHLLYTITHNMQTYNYTDQQVNSERVLLATILKESKHIIVLGGAGTSVSAGSKN